MRQVAHINDCECIMSHIWTSHVISVNESCHTYECVTSHISMRFVTHKNESCHTYECVMSHIWMSHVTHMSESCHIYEWVMSHIWMSHVTHMDESCHKYERSMSHMWRSVTQVSASLHIRVNHTRYCRCIGCHKLQVIFRKRVSYRRALLRKMTHQNKASYAASLPCITRTLQTTYINVAFMEGIDWFWLPIFRTNLVCGFWNKEMRMYQNCSLIY